jgi:Fur family transcriptional regulator, ferric uptake regulator
MTNTVDILKKAVLKATPMRIEVLSILSSSNFALDNQEIEEKLGTVDRITLYRTLKSFEEKGIIHKITDLSGNAKYAICDHGCLDNHKHDHHGHVHFHCETCKNTFCVENVIIPQISLPNNYKVTGQNITLTGKCEKCQQVL